MMEKIVDGGGQTFPLNNHNETKTEVKDGEQVSICNEEERLHEPVKLNDKTNGMDDDITEDVDQRPSPKPCEICEKDPSRYRCPRCSVRTCSVSCVNEHKDRLNCDGQRDKTAFVALSVYSDMHLLNDYRFLEGAERSVYSNKMAQNKQRHISTGPYHLNKRSKLLLSAAQKRGVKLRLVPPALSKNKSNTSFYVVKSDSLQWHVDWVFTDKNTSTLVKDPKVPDSTSLLEAAGKFTNFVQYPHLRKALEVYKKDKLSRCTFLLKLEGLPANRQRFFVLRPEASIADNLSGQCVTEYPTIYVLPESDSKADFQILSQEDMPHMKTDHARHMLQYHKHLVDQRSNLADQQSYREGQRSNLESQLLNPTSEIYRSTSVTRGGDIHTS